MVETWSRRVDFDSNSVKDEKQRIMFADNFNDITGLSKLCEIEKKVAKCFVYNFLFNHGRTAGPL